MKQGEGAIKSLPGSERETVGQSRVNFRDFQTADHDPRGSMTAVSFLQAQRISRTPARDLYIKKAATLTSRDRATANRRTEQLTGAARMPVSIA